MLELENHIRIDMDYASSPVWFSEDGKAFVNGEVDELKLSDNLVSSLEYYQKIWYEFQSDKRSPSIDDPIIGKFDSLEKYVEYLATLVSKELPDKTIYVWDDENLKNKKIK